MKKQIVCISSFCDNEEKMNVLDENVTKIKKLGLDIILLSPNFIEVKYDIISKCDFFFYTKENPLIGFPDRQYSHWYEFVLPDGRVLTLHRGFREYGWASLYQIKKLSQIALTFDYDIFHHVLYDLDITPEVENELIIGPINVNRGRINPKNPEEILDNGMLFMTFDRDTMIKIEKEIDYNTYINSDGFAESLWHKWKSKFNLGTSPLNVKDKIYYWGKDNHFDFSPSKDFKMFVSRNPEMQIWLGYEFPYPSVLTSNLRIVFFNFEDDFEIKFIINSKEFDLQPQNCEIIELPIDTQTIETITYFYKGNYYDFTKKYLDIPFNQIYYNYKN